VKPLTKDLLATVQAAAEPTAGVLRWGELLGLGVRPAQARTAVRRGEWTDLGNAAYAVDPATAGTPKAYAQQAAPHWLARSDRDEWVIGGTWAAAVHGLLLLDQPTGAPLLIRHDGRRGHRGSRRTLLPTEVVREFGLPFTSVPRAAVDAARQVGWPGALITMDSARRAGYAAAALVESAGRLSGVPGAIAVRHAVERMDRDAESALESMGRARMHDLGMPIPVQGFDLVVDGVLLGRVDHCWEELRVVAEADGRVKYDQRPALWKEKVREDGIREAGWEVFRYTWPDALAPSTAIRERFDRAVARAEARCRLRP
jgi:very-short-patch-repair endonuclease